MAAEHNRLEVPWRIRLARPRIVVCTIVVALACFLRCPSARPLPPAALHLVSALSEASSTNNNGPNIVFVLTDDLSWNLVQYMPHVLEMQDHGVTFTDYFVADSLCCPSRASIFTGLYPHNTGIFSNKGPDGGYVAFRKRGEERTTFAKALSAAGYRTAMMGKYLNGYNPRLDPTGLGWKSWLVGGSAYAEFNYLLNQDGEVVRHGSNPSDYLTDVLSQMAVSFIRQSAGEPFFIEIATFAPHSPYTPAPRDADALPGLRAPRTPAFDAEADSHAPRWLRGHPALSEEDITNIDQGFRKRAQSVLAVDAMVGSLQDALASTGQDQNTYFVFSSDNGYHMGEYRLTPGKMTAYDADIRVPLIVTEPGVAAGRTIEEIVENVDLAPTFTELAGAAQTDKVDGRSIVPLLLGDSVDRMADVGIGGTSWTRSGSERS